MTAPYGLPEKGVLYEMIVETANEGIWIKNEDHITTFVNETMASMLGYSADEMLGKTFKEFVFEEDLPEMEKRHAERMSGLSSGYELRLKKKSGDVIWTYINASPLQKDGLFFGSLGMVSDINDHKIKEFEHEENYRRYRSLFEDSPVPTWEEDFSGVKKFIDRLKAEGVKDIRAHFESNQRDLINCARLMVVQDVNDAVLKLNDAPNKEYMIKHYRSLATRRSAEYAIRQFEAIANGQKSCEFDAELRTFDENEVHVHLKWTVVKGYEDTYEKVYLTTTDVTERILAENERLRSSNLQKELLLKEIHHRVKNNLQIITSLLRLQSNTIEDPAIQELYEMSLHRINSMAFVHDLLYKAKDLSRIEFDVYLERLLESVVSSLQCLKCDIEYDLDVDRVELSISKSILLGLLINEIVTNSIKHGLSGQAKGKIYLRLTSDEVDYTLEIGDNGSGFEMVDDIESIESLGLQLIYNLADQLNGSIEKVEKERGTHFRIQFQEIGSQTEDYH